MLTVYPWQEQDYTHLMSLIKRLPNAILLYGPPGLGKAKLGLTWVARLFCEDPIQNFACGNCRSCLLVTQDTHPDLYRLMPSEGEDKKNKTISVGEVRLAMDFLSLSTHLANYKVIFVKNVGLLNLNSANALLKVLEEPPAKVLFILLSDNLNKVLPTIKSRCYKYQVSLPSSTVAKDYLLNKGIANYEFWLAYYDNCPLFTVEVEERQLELLLTTLASPSIENIFKLSQEIDGKLVSFGFFVEFMQKWITDLAQLKSANCLTYFKPYQDKISPLLAKLHLEKLFYLSDQLNFIAMWSLHPLNYKLQIENLLFCYQQLFVK